MRPDTVLQEQNGLTQVDLFRLCKDWAKRQGALGHRDCGDKSSDGSDGGYSNKIHLRYC